MAEFIVLVSFVLWILSKSSL